MNQNTIRIWYNPYKKNIRFQRVGENGSWRSLSSSSNLLEFQNGKYSIQNCGEEIIKLIDKEQNVGNNGIVIEFLGTESDFKDFYDINESLNNKSIKLEYNKSNTLPESQAAMKVIESAYEALEAEFTEYMGESNDLSYSQRSIGEYISKFNDIKKPDINICIIGNYSVGKSTFINALIGEELLPSATDPTTARVMKIRNDNNYSIEFSYKDKTISMNWSNNKYYYSGSIHDNYEIANKIDEYIYTEKTIIEQMHQVLQMLNQKYEDDGKILDEILKNVGTEIKLKIPFVQSKLKNNKFSFVIFDTPGSNAGTYADTHKKVLEKTLSDQTNAFPIVLFDRKNLDSTDNENLTKQMQDFDNKLDNVNKLVVINMADTMTVDELTKGIDESISKKWKLNKILYTSSIIALGAKKETPIWIDKGADEKFETRKSHFLKGSKYFKQLYKYNCLPEKEYNEIKLNCEQISSDEQRQLLNNSGIVAAEYLINQFACKYANYLKAEESCDYLMNILKKVETEKNKLTEDLKEEQSDYQNKRIGKKKELIKKIKEIEISDKEIQKIEKELEVKYSDYLEEFCETLYEKTAEKWNETKIKNLKGEQATKQCHGDMISYCNECYEDIFPMIENEMIDELNKLASLYQQRIIKVINADEEISDSVKERLNNTKVKEPKFKAKYKSFKIDMKAFSKVFLFWGVKIDPKKYSKALRFKLTGDFNIDCIRNPLEIMKNDFGKWKKENCNNYLSNIDEASLTLKKYDEKIDELEKTISKYSESLKKMSDKNSKLNKLLIFREDKYNEK
ncbi:dynamin family protein [Clostridium sp. DL1XJH146]